MVKCMTAWVGRDNLFEGTTAGSVDLLHILNRQSTEQYNIESSCVDLNNAIVVWSISDNAKNEHLLFKTYSYHECKYSWSDYKYEYWAVESEYEYLNTWNLY